MTQGVLSLQHSRGMLIGVADEDKNEEDQNDLSEKLISVVGLYAARLHLPG
jgi:hypothetical protein